MASLPSEGKEAKCLVLKTISLSEARGKSQARIVPLKRDSGSLKFSPRTHRTMWAHVTHLSPSHLPVLLLEVGQGYPLNLNPLAVSFAA